MVCPAIRSLTMVFPISTEGSFPKNPADGARLLSMGQNLVRLSFNASWYVNVLHCGLFRRHCSKAWSIKELLPTRLLILEYIFTRFSNVTTPLSTKRAYCACNGWKESIIPHKQANEKKTLIFMTIDFVRIHRPFY